VAVAAALGPSITDAAQLTLTWVDTSGGQAAFSVERKTGSTGTYAQVALQAAGFPSYVDTSVTSGTTYCYRVQAFDSVGASGYSNEACASPVGALDLTVVKGGTGTGSVTSSPAGISCGTDCFESYAGGSVVTLTAAATSGSTFSGWSGGCIGTAACTLTGNTALAVTATFGAIATPTVTLTVYRRGPGSVSSSPAGISCGSTCSAHYAKGTVVTLTAVPESGAKFLRWSGGGCSGTATCTVTLNTKLSVWATFARTR
jgi:List-Bact-rpt repeat protein